ncbi:MAG: hypothetical protein L0Y56_21335 [Nitrospira sp.]|nr:hypothetical protein [Nitrospira sp.]
MGENLYGGDEGNPTGYFEDREINSINEELLSQVIPSRPAGILGYLFFRSRPVLGQRWLAQLPVETSIPCPAHLSEQILALVKREPFCFKDPRFCYTLPVWWPFLRNTVFICIFRHPSATIKSVLKAYHSTNYLNGPLISFQKAMKAWEFMYRHVLEIHYPKGGE